MLARHLMLLAWVFAAFSTILATAGDSQPSKPKIIISKATTHITSPLTKDGLPDYAGALNEFYGKEVTPQNNAVVLYYELFGAEADGTDRPDEFFRLLGIPKPTPVGNHYINLGVYLEDTLKVELSSKRYFRVLDDQDLAMNRPWKSSDFPEIAGWLEINKKPLARLQEAAQCSRYFFPIVWKDGEERHLINGLTELQLPNVQRMRSFSRALNARVMLHLGEGRREAAWQDVMACHRLGRLVGDGPMLIKPLVGIAISDVARGATLVFLEQTQPTSKQVAVYLRDLDTLAPLHDMANVIDRAERYSHLDLTITLANSPEEDLSDAFNDFDERHSKLLSGVPFSAVDWNVTLRTGNAWYDRLVDAMKKPTHHDRQLTLDKLDAEGKTIRENTKDIAKRITAARTKPQKMGQLVGDMLAAFLLQHILMIQLAEDRALQRHANLRITFAPAGYKADNGKYPKSLGQLAPKYLKKIPEDLFSGKPLKYQVTKDGYLLHSVGPNSKDDGGRWSSDKRSGDDLYIRMPLPKPKARQDGP